MRILLVDAFASANKDRSHRDRYERVRQHVVAVVKELEKTEVTDIDLVERTRLELDDFLFEMHSEFSNPQTITKFDLLDFVIVAGDPNGAPPWAPSMRKLTLVTKMCMMTGKCFFGIGIGAQLLAFVCSTGGEYLRVMNNSGLGTLIDDIRAVPPPPSQATAGSAAPGRANDVLLDTKTGDFFVFDPRERTWIPQGNTGIVLHSSDLAKHYGARPNSARAGTRPVVRAQLSQPLMLSKRGETKCCCRLEFTQHTLLQKLPHREFVVNCKSKWDLDERIATTGNNRYRVLMDSSRGPMLVEFGNSVGSHFMLSKDYPETCQLLRSFVLAKYRELQVHAYIDRSYVSAISGSSRVKDRLNVAQTKTLVHSKPRIDVGTTTNNNQQSHHQQQPQPHRLVDGSSAVMTLGRTSPKRCRPVSAGPYRSSSKASHPVRMIKTSRSVYPSSTLADAHEHSVQPSLFARHDAFAVDPPAPKQQVPGPEQPSISHNTTDHALASNQSMENQAPARPTTATRRVRVSQKNEVEKPYCAINRYNKLKEVERQQSLGTTYYSVVNDAPYQSSSERDALDAQKSKLKWVAGPFRSAIGKATTRHVTPEAGVFTNVPFVQKNAPYYIIQRRVLEEAPPPSHHRPATASASRSSSSNAKSRVIK